MNFLLPALSGEKVPEGRMRGGRFHAARNASQYEVLARRIANQPKGLEVKAHAVPRLEQRCELGSDIYHGGVVNGSHASMDPGRYHQGLLERVRAVGADIIAHCPVTTIEKCNGGFRVQTNRGVINARDVVIATLFWHAYWAASAGPLRRSNSSRWAQVRDPPAVLWQPMVSCPVNTLLPLEGYASGMTAKRQG